MPAQKQPKLEVEEKQGTKAPVTVVRFLISKLAESEDIQQLGDQLYSLVEEHGRKNLLLNFSKVQFTASYFLGKMLGLRQRVLKADGRLALVIKPGSLVEEVFEVCGFLTLFEVYATEEEALQSF